MGMTAFVYFLLLRLYTYLPASLVININPAYLERGDKEGVFDFKAKQVSC